MVSPTRLRPQSSLTALSIVTRHWPLFTFPLFTLPLFTFRLVLPVSLYPPGRPPPNIPRHHPGLAIFPHLMRHAPAAAFGRLATFSVVVGTLLPGSLAAQVQWTARLGAVGSTAIVSDQIVSPLTVTPAIAPTLLLGGSIPMDDKGRRFSVELGLASGSYDSKENGTTTDLGTLRTATLTAGAEGLMAPGLHWRVAIGFISYLPAEKTGIFQDGAPTRVAGGAGLEYRRAWRPGWDLSVALRWDYHRFTTSHLQALGFTGNEDVHRITLAIGVVR